MSFETGNWPRKELRLNLHFHNTLFEKGHFYTSQTPMWLKKALKFYDWHCNITILKFLEERENKQLLQVQITRPGGMDGHHQWHTTDRITSSQQQISHGVVMQGKKSNTCMSLLTDILYVWNYRAVVTNASKNCSPLIKCCWTYIVLWWHHNINLLVGLTFVVHSSWHLGFGL